MGRLQPSRVVSAPELGDELFVRSDFDQVMLPNGTGRHGVKTAIMYV